MTSLPICQICRKHFSLKGPAPFLLPCLHDVCETCVTAAAGGVVSCSTCQRDVNLTETSLQKDVITEKEVLHLTVNNNPELVLCTHEEDGNQAVCWCRECEDFFCENCQNLHNSFRGTRVHTVQNVSELKTGSLNQDRYCSIHPKFITDTWDKDCCMLTCATCRRTDHADHKFVYVDETADSERKEVESLQRDVTATTKTQKIHLSAITQDISSSEQTFNMLPEKIAHTFNALKTLNDQREKELQIELQQQKEKILKDLRTKKNTSENSLQRCRTTSDYINKTLQYGSLHDILELRPVLEAKSQDCRRSAPCEDYKPLSLPVFNTGGQEKIKSTLAQFGTIATDIDQIEGLTAGHDQQDGRGAEVRLNYAEEETTSQVKARQTWRLSSGVGEDEIQATFPAPQPANVPHRRNGSQRAPHPGKAVTHEMEARGLEELKRETKMTEDISLLKLHQESFIKQKEKPQESGEEANKLKQELEELRSCLYKVIREEQEAERISGLYRFRSHSLEESFLLICTNIRYSQAKYNAECVHINAEDELFNEAQSNPPHSDQRLTNCWGTSSTDPLPQCGSPQYFEVKSEVGIEEALTGTDLLLEIGLAREEEQDLSHWIGRQPHSYSLNVAHCSTHSSICREIRRHGKSITCLPDTLENNPGTSTTLHYGVVYDSARSRIAFIDVTDTRIIGKIDNVDTSVALWPMFGVYYPSSGQIGMSLVVGKDIDMTDRKKTLILDCFS